MRQAIVVTVSTVVMGLALHAQSAPAPPKFRDAQIRVQEGEKTRDVWSTIEYGDTALLIAPRTVEKKKPDTTRTIAYADVASGEYTYGKSPRVAAALLISPFALFSSSKSHWLTVKLKNSDFALLRLDKSNYKMVIAELEKRAKIKVESIGEAK